MKLTHRSATQGCECECCENYDDKIEFQKIVESRDMGLTIYQYTPQTQDQKDAKGEVFILRNTKTTKVTKDDLTAVFEQNVVTCPKCLKSIIKAENFLRNVSVMEKDEVTGICDHCVRRRRPLSSICMCKGIVDKFLLEEEEQRKQLKAWLEEVTLQLKKTAPDHKQRHKLKTLSQSETSLNTAVSKFSKTDYKHFAEIQSGSRLPNSPKATSSLDSLHDVQRLPIKGFEYLITPSEYPKRKYSRRKLQETKLRESIFSDVREYIERVMSPEANGPVSPGHITKDSDKVSAANKLQRFDSHLDISKEPENKIKRKRGTILELDEDEKTKPKQTSILRGVPAHPDSDRRKSSFSPPPWKQTSDDSFLKVIREKLPKDFSFSFPREKKETKVVGKSQVSSSELIKNTQDMLRTKAEEEKRKIEEENEKKRIEQELKKLDQEKKKEEALAAKAAKAAFEEKKRQEAKLDKEKLEQERRKTLEENVDSFESGTEKLEGNKNTPNTSLSSKKKRTLSEKTKTDTDKESLGFEKKTRISKEDIKGDKEAIKKDKDHREKDIKKEVKQRKPKDDLLKSKPAAKEPRVVEQKLTKPNKETIQKPVKEQKHESDQTNESKQKKPDEKQYESDQKQIKKPMVGEKENKYESDQSKESKQKMPDEQNQKHEGDKSEIKVPKPKTTEEKKPESEPKEKVDKSDKLENETLKALLASQLKEKQEQEKNMREQQKAEELARKKAEEALKSSRAGDKSAKADAEDKLKKVKQMAAIPTEHAKKDDLPTNKEFEVKQVKVMRPSYDNLIVQLVKLKQGEERVQLRNISPGIIRQHGREHRKYKGTDCIICSDSDLALQFEELEKEQNIVNIEKAKDIIIGEKIFKCKASYKIPVDDFNDLLGNDLSLHKLEEQSKLKEGDKDSKPTRTTKPKTDAVDQESNKGVIRYALSDRSFIEKGWTMLPTEKVVRKMNVYRMRPAHPEFDWFEHNKYKRVMQYDCGATLAEFDDSGRGRWFYRSGKLALDYYDAEELNAQQRFVVYSSGEPDERGRTRPRTILAAFDYLGNGVVFDHTGKIRLKYNQTEGVVLDRSIGPVSHWKWHTLNDPPVLQQVMIDTQMSFKDPRILQLGEKNQEKAKLDNEEMLAIEFDNFIKEKSRKLTQKFKPFQIKMKALKINEYFSLRVLDQASVYLLFRDGTTNLKINIGMILDHKEIVDTDTAEVGEVSNSLERLPARTDSIAALQQAVAQAQRAERARVGHERRLKRPEPCASADQLRAGTSRPLRPPLVAASSTGIQCHPQCPSRFRKPSSSNLYYDTQI